jgi:hypothetical protein
VTSGRSWRRRLAAVAAAAALAGAGCSSDEATSPEAAAPPTAAAPTTSVPPLDPDGLEPLVVDQAPSGFALADDAEGATGATDLAAAAADATDPEAGTALAEAGFVRGWQRLWVSDDGSSELFLLVYEFAASEGAGGFFARTAGGAATEGGEGVFEVPGIPGAVGVTGGGDGLSVQAVLFTTGPYVVQVIGNGPDPGPSRGTVVALAAAQAEQLA